MKKSICLILISCFLGINFVFSQLLPTVHTSAVISITTNSAKCGGYVTSLGSTMLVARGVCWSTSHNPTIYNNHTHNGYTLGSFITNITGLLPNTTYYVRAYASDSIGTGYGNEITFTTATVKLPVVYTNSASNITSNSAKCGGYVDTTGNPSVTARGVCWSTSTNPTIINNHTNDGAGLGSFTSNISGLSASTTYYVRAYATNNFGTSYGTTVTFTTLSVGGCGTPSGLTATSITQTSAKLGWTTVQGAIKYNVQYKKNGASSWTSIISTTNTKTISGLSAGTTYIFRVQTVCSSGTSSFSYNITFSTLWNGCGTPTGLVAASITTNSATLGWTVVTGATKYNIQYKKTSASTWTNAVSYTNTKAISGLTASTAYQFKVQAVCPSGISAYSSIATFTTSANSGNCGTPTGLTATSITSTSAKLGWTAVSGAIKYNVQYKKYGTSSWTTIISTKNYRTITGLSDSTYYEFRVQTVCSSGLSSFSASKFFVTLYGGFKLTNVINNENETSVFDIYPNPAKNTFFINYYSNAENNIKINIIDITGRLVSSNDLYVYNGKNNYSVDINTLDEGLYIVELINGSVKKTNKLIINK